MSLLAFPDVSGFLQPDLLLALWNAVPSLAARLRERRPALQGRYGAAMDCGRSNRRRGPASGGCFKRVSTPLASACDLRPRIPVSPCPIPQTYDAHQNAKFMKEQIRKCLENIEAL